MARTFQKDGRTVETDDVDQAVRLKFEGWRETQPAPPVNAEEALAVAQLAEAEAVEKVAQEELVAAQAAALLAALTTQEVTPT